jgi:hypothetical protein
VAEDAEAVLCAWANCVIKAPLAIKAALRALHLVQLR